MENYGFAINITGNSDAAIEKLRKSLNGLSKQTEKTSNGFNELFGAFTAANIVQSAIGGIKSFATSIVTLGVDMEQTKTSFEVMLGSASAANKMVGEMKHFADVTPFDNKTIYDAGKLLLNYGVAAEDVIPNIKLLGDASGGVAERFDRMTYAFAQIRSMGRLQGQDLRQLIDAGFNPLQEISDKTGQSMSDLKKKMEDGLISFDMVEAAFRSATGEGGRFFGMMDKQSQTIGGLFSTLRGNVQTSMVGIFDSIKPAMQDAMNIMSDNVGIIDSMLKSLAQPMVDLANSLSMIIVQFDYLGESFNKLIQPLTDLKDRFAGLFGSETMDGLAQFAKSFDIIHTMTTGIVEAFSTAVRLFSSLAAGGDAFKEKHSLESFTQGFQAQWNKNPAEEKEKLNKGIQSFTSAVGGPAAQMQAMKDKLTMSGVGGGGGKDAITKNASKTSSLGGASGGLGQAKVVTINIENMLRINADKVDSNVIQKDGQLTVEEMIRILNDVGSVNVRL